MTVNAGYFDTVGIIRDVMQNHLMQTMSMIGMEKPNSLDVVDLTRNKTEFLKCIEPVELDDIVVGQVTASDTGRGYKEVLAAEKGDVNVEYVWVP